MTGFVFWHERSQKDADRQEINPSEKRTWSGLRIKGRDLNGKEGDGKPDENSLQVK
jgi:hypothetical protein